MQHRICLKPAVVMMVALASWLLWPQGSLEASDAPARPAGEVQFVKDACPGLASSGLTYARLSDLPKGTLLKAGDLILTEKDVADEIAKAPPEVQAQLKKNGFFLLEQIAGPKLIV